MISFCSRTFQHAGLRLSADLLRAILLNCLAYSESTKRAKSREESLQAEVENLKAELRRYVYSSYLIY